MVHHFTEETARDFNVDKYFSQMVEHLPATYIGASYDFSTVRTYEMGLAAFWGMDEVVNGRVPDETDRGFSGRVTNGSLVPGRFGTALSLAAGGGLDPDASPLTATAPSVGFAVGGWVQPNLRDVYGQPRFSGLLFERSYENFVMGFAAFGAANWFGCGAQPAEMGAERVTASAYIDPARVGEWIHLLCNYDPSTGYLTVYVDGVPDITHRASVAFGSFPTTMPNRAAVGGRPSETRGPTEAPFDGSIDEFGVWGRSLTDAEVLALATSSAPVSPRAESRVQSGRIDPGSAFSDATIQWSVPEGALGFMYVSTDAGATWCKIENGDSLSSLAGRCALPGRGLLYRYIFFDASPLDTVQVLFSTGVSELPRTAIPIGLNIADLNDWATQHVFKDTMTQARAWITRTQGSYEWDSGFQSAIPLRSDGYPEVIPFTPPGGGPQIVHTLVTTANAARRTGVYSLRFEGEGIVHVLVAGNPGDASYTFSSLDGDSGCIQGGGTTRSPVCPVTYSSRDQTIFLQILESRAGNPVRDIRLIDPEFNTATNAEINAAPFLPRFLESVRGAAVLRFMDWMHTNSQSVPTRYSWATRTTPASFTQTGASGTAMEYIVMLSNLVGADPWICIPHGAPDELIQSYAEFMEQHLDPGRRLYIEFSNELWNGAFGQGNYSWNRPEGRARYVAERSINMFRIFENVFTDDSRLVKIIPGHAAGATYNDEVLELARSPSVNPTGIGIDALAIAPYIGGSVPNELANIDAELSFTSDSVIDRLSQLLWTEYRGFLTSNRAVADEHGVTLIAYEGGHHLAALGGEENNHSLTQLMFEANRHPRMRTLYLDMLSIWAQEGGELFTVFNTTNSYSKWGMWGLKEAWDQPILDAPKYAAIREQIDRYELERNPDVATCGNGIVEPGEECDGASFSPALFPDGISGAAYSRNYVGGELGCNPNCSVSTANLLPRTDCSLRPGSSWDEDGWEGSRLANLFAKLYVLGLNCLHEVVEVDIYEGLPGDEIADRFVTSMELRFDEPNIAVGRWQTTLEGAVGGDPTRYYYVARLAENPAETVTSYGLRVCSSLCECHPYDPAC